MNPLQEKIRSKTAKIGIIGFGYVGLPLAVEFAKAGFKVTGIDINPERVDQINKGESYLNDLTEENAKTLVNNKKLEATSDYGVLSRLDVILICVPTPLTKMREPDISPISESCQQIAKYLKGGRLVILESTTYPGTTTEAVLPILQSSGLIVGQDFFLAFSPERIDPGRKDFTIKNTPKIVGGVTSNCTILARTLYEQIVDRVIPVSSPKVAEMAKLLENIYRVVNIALVNELAILSDRMGIDIWEVIDAASTKPFGFTPFFPGPGLGGHCIPIDPFYLAWKARKFGLNTKFIELAGEINTNMPYYVVSKITKALNSRKKSLNSSEILILGIAYKPDIKDIRGAPALKIIELLQNEGATVKYNDPYVPQLKVNGEVLDSISLKNPVLKDVDCAVIVTNHSSYDYEWIAKNAKLIIDTRNALKKVNEGSAKIVKI